MTEPTPSRSIPPLDLDAIEARLARRVPAEDAGKRVAVTEFLVGRDALALGEEYLTRGDLTSARRWLRIATSHSADGAHELLSDVNALIDATSALTVDSGVTGHLADQEHRDGDPVNQLLTATEHLRQAVATLRAARFQTDTEPRGPLAPLAAARDEVLIMYSRGAEFLDHIVDLENLRRGVHYRVVLPASVDTPPGLARLAAGGADVRTAPLVPTTALVVDGQVAALPMDRTTDDQSVAVFRLPGVVTTVVELFERIWSTAAPMTTAAEESKTDLTPREQQLLSLLSSGSTDQEAATALNVSVRTVRRMIAGVMNQLGARSRFAAGVKAADRGWLDPRRSNTGPTTDRSCSSTAS